MKEDILCDLALYPAEIYLPSRRGCRLPEGKSCIFPIIEEKSWHNKDSGGWGGKRDSWRGGNCTNIYQTKIYQKTWEKGSPEEIGGPYKVSSPRAPTCTRPRSKRVRFGSNVAMVKEPL